MAYGCVRIIKVIGMVHCTFCKKTSREEPVWICYGCFSKGKKRGRKYCVFCNCTEELRRIGLVWACHDCIAELQENIQVHKQSRGDKQV
jgi:ribosomal protein L37AE/L43A